MWNFLPQMKKKEGKMFKKTKKDSNEEYTPQELYTKIDEYLRDRYDSSLDDVDLTFDKVKDIIMDEKNINIYFALTAICQIIENSFQLNTKQLLALRTIATNAAMIKMNNMHYENMVH